MRITISPEKFLELTKKGYSLDLVYLLKLYEQKADISDLYKESVKFQVLNLSLLRKGLISGEGELTLMGKELLEFIDSNDKVKLVRKKASEELFEEWWKTFPGTNQFEFNGKTFTGSRAMRVKKEECKIKYYSILNEGIHTSTQILEALKLDVLMKKQESFRTKENKLTYMQNSLTYLNQKSYEPFIELLGSKTKEETSQSFDI